MAITRLVGPAAAARKYDLLTAMGTLALAAAPGEQRLILRLMVAITARYNWAGDTLAVGQAELARMWSVDERTVKRGMAELRRRGWLIQKRAAGRGRVAEYRLGLEQVLHDTRPAWAAVGSDFVARVADAPPPPSADRNVVPFPAPVRDATGAVWPRVLDHLAASDPATARAWLQGLRDASVDGAVLRLVAPGRFHATYIRTHLAARILRAAQTIERGVLSVLIQCAGEDSEPGHAG